VGGGWCFVFKTRSAFDVDSFTASSHPALNRWIFLMLDLNPFGDALAGRVLSTNSFDVVLSSLAIHNISSRAGREKAVSEAVRVLRPGGRLVIVDVRATGQYKARLAELGMSDVARCGMGWRFWWSGPLAVTGIVTATKPGRPL